MHNTSLEDLEISISELFKFAPYIIWISDERGFIQYCNQRAYEYLGFDKNAQAPGDWTPFLHPDDLEEIGNKWNYGMENKVQYSNQSRMKKHTGEYFWFRTEATPILDKNGNIRNWIGFNIDIDKEKTLQEEISFSNERMDLAINISNLGMWDWDIEKDSIFYSGVWGEMLGYKWGKDKKHDPKLWEEMLHPEDKELTLKRLNEYVEGKSAKYEAIYRLKTKSGDWKWILDSGRAVERAEDNSVKRMIGMHVDYDTRKISENLMLENERKMSILARSAKSLLESNNRKEIYDILCDNTYEYLGNSGIAIITEYSEDYLQWEIKAIKGLKRSFEVVTNLIGTSLVGLKGSLPSEVVFKMQSGKVQYLDNNLSNLSGGKITQILNNQINKILGFKQVAAISLIQNQRVYGTISILITKDNFVIDEKWLETLAKQASVALDRRIAEKKTLIQNEELKRLNNELDLIIQAISHDLKAPLKTATGLLNLRKVDKEAFSEEEMSLQIQKSINKLDLITDDLLGIVFNNRTELEISSIKLNEVIEACVNEQEGINYFDEIEWDIKTNQKHDLFTDEKRLKMILRNILSNAIKYQNPGNEIKKIRVYSKTSSKLTEIRVEDNGKGIHEKQLKKIFDVFYRADANTDGIGLGLNIIKQTSEKLNGKINIDSEYGEGTTFYLTIPNLKN